MISMVGRLREAQTVRGRGRPRRQENLPIPASLVYQVREIVILGTLVKFLAVVVRDWLSIGHRKFCGIRG